VSLFKRWLLGTHQGAVSVEHLDYYLDELTFRFNRRKSRSPGTLFFRLVQQAVAAEPTTYRSIIESGKADWTPNHNLWGYLSEVDTHLELYRLADYSYIRPACHAGAAKYESPAPIPRH
jgi:hypothetical protein